MRRTFPCYAQVLQLPQCQLRQTPACVCVCVWICIPLCHNLVEVALMVVQQKEKQAWNKTEKKERQLQIWMAANEIKWKRNTQARATPASAPAFGWRTSHLQHTQTTITTFHRNRMHNCIKCPKFDLKMLHTFRQRSKCSWTGVTRRHTQPQNIKRTKILQI